MISIHITPLPHDLWKLIQRMVVSAFGIVVRQRADGIVQIMHAE